MADDLVVDVGDARLHVDVRGIGPPLVVLHGFTGSAAAMTPLTDRLVADHRLIVPDLVGHGRSSVPADPAAYTVDAMVLQVLGIADAVGCTTFHLVGYSMGGRIALTLGCQAPHRVRSLTLIGATAGLVDEESRAERRRIDEARARLIETDLERFVDDWMANPLFAGQQRLGAEFLADSRAHRLASSQAGLAASLRAAGTGSMPPVNEALGRCNMPTMLVVGDEDEKFLAVAGEMSEALPRCSTTVVADAGHSVHVEQPDAVAGRIRELVAAVEGL